MKVLIVEDEPAIAQDIEMTLEDSGFDVVGIAMDSTKALDLLMNRQPDIAILDIAIKGDKTGIDIGHIINKKYKIPFVFLTAFSDADTLDAVKETFPYGYIVKPFKDRDLVPALEIAMVRHSAFAKQTLSSREKINQALGSAITKMEYRVLEEIWNGKDNMDIANSCHISVNTVKTHIGKILTKLDVKSRGAALAKIRGV